MGLSEFVGLFDGPIWLFVSVADCSQLFILVHFECILGTLDQI